MSAAFGYHATVEDLYASFKRSPFRGFRFWGFSIGRFGIGFMIGQCWDALRASEASIPIPHQEK